MDKLIHRSLGLAFILTVQWGGATEPRLGEPFPAIEGTAVTGESVSLEALKGKPVLVDFWATWCMPCLQEMPNLKRAHDKFHSMGFEIIGISLDQSREELMAYLEQNELPWPILNAEGGWKSQYAETFSVDSIPALFLIHPDGTLVSKTARGARLLEWIRHLLDPEYPLTPDEDEELMRWKESSGAEREAAQARILKWSTSPALADDMNIALWNELLEPFWSEDEIAFLSTAAEKLVQAHPRENFLDTYAYALYRRGVFSEAAQVQGQAVQAVTKEEVTPDYGWLLEARLALYLARAGNLEEANRVFTATLARREKVEELYHERVDWLAEAADLLDRGYEEPWESEMGVDAKFYYARFEGIRSRVRKRYERLLASLEEEERKGYAVAFGKVQWPESLRGGLSTVGTLPLGIEVRDATGGADLVRVKKVGPGGDFAILLDAPRSSETDAPSGGTLVLEGDGLSTETRDIAIRGGDVTDLGEILLLPAE